MAWYVLHVCFALIRKTCFRIFNISVCVGSDDLKKFANEEGIKELLLELFEIKSIMKEEK